MPPAALARRGAGFLLSTASELPSQVCVASVARPSTRALAGAACFLAMGVSYQLQGLVCVVI